MHTARTLTENLAALLRSEHHALAEFLVALADFDRRRAWAELGYASLFSFLHRELRLSKGAAQYRKVAAELIQEVPAVIEPLRRGELCLTSIIEAAKVVTPENWQVMLPRFFRLSKREAMELVAALEPHPAPPVRTVVTSIRPAASASTAPSSLGLGLGLGLAAPAADLAATPAAPAGRPDEPATAPVPARPAPARPEIVPLSGSLSRLHVTVSKRFTRKLAEARDARPGMTDEALLEAALDLLLAQVAKRRGLVAKPQRKPRPSNPYRPPAHVRREVWERDGGCCAVRLESGEICGSTHGLQFDHIEPRALGGPSTVENTRLACVAHNLESARRIFGAAVMDRYAGKKARRRRAAAARPELAVLPGLDPPPGAPRATSS